MKLTQKHNIARNDPFFAVEVFENRIEFHSIAVPTTLAYELPIEERLICFAEACDKKDLEETRAFYLVVEKGEKLWLRKIVMNLEKLVGEEELKAEDLYSFEKPEEATEQALVVGEKLYLKSETQIVVAKEGVVELP